VLIALDTTAVTAGQQVKYTPTAKLVNELVEAIAEGGVRRAGDRRACGVRFLQDRCPPRGYVDLHEPIARPDLSTW
jgi:hypothetical protein